MLLSFPIKQNSFYGIKEARQQPVKLEEASITIAERTKQLLIKSAKPAKRGITSRKHFSLTNTLQFFIALASAKKF